MPKIRYVEDNGKEHDVDVPNGWSLMEGAVKNLIPGIDATCGGCCSCATCRVFVAPEWETRIPPKEEMETMMLESVLEFESVREPARGWRLSCQIQITPELDGLVVRMPKSQQ